MGIHLLGLPAVVFVTLSQARYGAQLSGLRALQHHNYSTANSTRAALGFLWQLPEEVRSSRGLGSGITWAWDDSLCDAIQPLFSEDLFFAPLVRCFDLKAAMHRAFDSWAANHRFISFVDVSEECRQRDGAVTRDCALAELFVTARPPAEIGSLEAATATPSVRRNDEGFRYTSGDTAQYWDPATGAFRTLPVLETVGGVIAFGGRRTDGDHLCWYLDSTFCARFHHLKVYSDPQAIRALVLALTIVISLLAGLVTLVQLLFVLRSACERRGTCALRWKAAAEELGQWSFCMTALRYVAIITPILFYRQIFSPCFDCYDFEAAATHEVGHILGLSHPDRASESLSSTCAQYGDCGPPGVDVRLASPPRETLSSTPCTFTFDAVVPNWEPTPRPSIMISFTQHTSTVCLEQDDLEALNVLYPDCGAQPIQTPVCFKTQHNIGWVRLAVYTLFPVLLALCAAVVIGSFTQRQQLRRIKSASLKLRQKSALLLRVKKVLGAAQDEAAAAHEALHVQVATEETRIAAALDARVDVEILRRASNATPPPPRASAHFDGSPSAHGESAGCSRTSRTVDDGSMAEGSAEERSKRSSKAALDRAREANAASRIAKRMTITFERVGSSSRRLLGDVLDSFRSSGRQDSGGGIRLGHTTSGKL